MWGHILNDGEICCWYQLAHSTKTSVEDLVTLNLLNEAQQIVFDICWCLWINFFESWECLYNVQCTISDRCKTLKTFFKQTKNRINSKKQ